MKRTVDVGVAAVALIITMPVLLLTALLIWLQDRQNPIYVSLRVRSRRSTFRMYKFRSMVVNADRLGGTSTSADDRRITPMGRIARAFKIDELPQFWNVLIGDMSVVGPRPQVVQDASRYTREENRLFDVRPGVTDFASIVFADESDILEGASDPDARYDALIRPWKSRLGILYSERHSVWVDVQVAMLTAVGIASRPAALRGVQKILTRIGADPELIRVAGRTEPLVPTPPPGAGIVDENGPFLPESVFERAVWLQTLNRIRRGPVVALQLLIVAFANVGAWVLRSDGTLSGDELAVIQSSLIWLVAIRAIVFAPFGLYRGLWRYSGVYDLTALIGGVFVSSAVFAGWVLFAYPPDLYPRTIVVIDALLLVFLLGAVRMSRRIVSEFTRTPASATRVLIYGAGATGEIALRDMRHRPQAGEKPVGLIDDDFRKLGVRIHGVPVLGGRRDLHRIAARIRPDELLIAIPSLDASEVEEFAQFAKSLGIPVKNAPVVTTSPDRPEVASAITEPSIKTARALDRNQCPVCRRGNVNRSKARTAFERMRRKLSIKRLHRCVDCGWRGWMEPVATISGTLAAIGSAGLSLGELTDGEPKAGTFRPEDLG